MYDTMLLYSVGSMYRHRSVVRTCTVFCLKAQMHWKHQFFVLLILSSEYFNISALTSFGGSAEAPEKSDFLVILFS